MIRLIKIIYEKAASTVKIYYELTEWIMTKIGTRQGFFLSLTLFIIVLECIFKIALEKIKVGALYARETLNNLKFADDINLIREISRSDRWRWTNGQLGADRGCK